MSNVKLSFLLLYFSMILSSEPPDHLHITRRTDLIYQRFYLIKRLHDPVHVLLECHIQPELFDHMDALFFNHAEIQSIVNEMKAACSVKPLQAIWERFNAYQYLFDAIFADECIQLVCSLYLIQKPDSIKSLSSREQRLDFLDTVVDITSNQSVKLPLSTRADHVDITTDQIAQRYFVLKRLRKAMGFLGDVHRQDKNPFSSDTLRTTIDYTEDVRDDLKQFSHDRIKKCLRNLCQEKNLEPVDCSMY